MKRAFLLCLAFLLSLGLGVAAEEVKYGVAETIYFHLLDPAGVDLETTAVCVTGDVKFSEDGAAFANTSNCFVDETNGWYSLAMLATELQGEAIAISVVDQTATKVWLDQPIKLTTYGHPSARHNVDRESQPFNDGNCALLRGVVDTGSFTPTTIALEADLTDCDGAATTIATANRLVDRVIVFREAASTEFEAVKITGSSLVGGNMRLDFSGGMTVAASSGDVFVIF